MPKNTTPITSPLLTTLFYDSEGFISPLKTIAVGTVVLTAAAVTANSLSKHQEGPSLFERYGFWGQDKLINNPEYEYQLSREGADTRLPDSYENYREPGAGL